MTGDMGEYFRDHREWKKEEKDELVARRTAEIEGLAAKYSLKLEWIEPWQARLSTAIGFVDLWLPRGRFHIRRSGQRGAFTDVEAFLREKDLIS